MALVLSSLRSGVERFSWTKFAPICAAIRAGTDKYDPFDELTNPVYG
jgi:hypothetical protein